MSRLEIPALYRLDLGSSKWGWHKMADLVTAVDLLIERLPEEILPPLKQAENVSEDYVHRLKGKRLLMMFGHLNKDQLFAWSDEIEVSFDSLEKVPWDRPNLFVPARWSLDVISAVKNYGQPSKLNELQLFEVASSCLYDREKLILRLRLGLSDEKPLGVPWSVQQVAKKFGVTRTRIAQIEHYAIGKMERQYSSIKEKDYVRPYPVDSVHIDDLDFSVRTRNCLSNADLYTIGGIRQKTYDEMLRLKNFGRKSLREVSDKLKARGIDLGWF